MKTEINYQRIFIIEDDLSFQFIWKKILNKKFPNANLEWATNATEALLTINDHEKRGRPFDMVISDVFLSGDKTGIDVVHEISSFFKGKIVLVSGTALENISLMLPKSTQFSWISKSNLMDFASENLNNVLDLQTKTEKVIQYKPVVLVTGCRSGIGLALAKALVKQKNYRVVITARPETIDDLKKEFEESDQVMIRGLDVTEPNQIAALVNEIHCLWRGLDVLINNAGVCYRSVVEHMDSASEMEQIKTNYLGPLTLIRYAIPAMREKGRGKIINISSVSGIMAMPTMSSYSASKHALEAASEALWHEMQPFGINVSVVRPGFVCSNSFKQIRTSRKAKLSNELEGPYSDFYDFFKPFVAKFMQKSPSSPEIIADKIIKCIQEQNPPLWINATPDSHLFSFITKIVPQRWLPKLLHSLLPGNKSWGASYTKASPRRLSA